MKPPPNDSLDTMQQNAGCELHFVPLFAGERACPTPRPGIADRSFHDVPPPTELIGLQRYCGQNHRVAQCAKNQRPIPAQVGNARGWLVKEVSA